jgi:hypothetical protein
MVQVLVIIISITRVPSSSSILLTTFAREITVVSLKSVDMLSITHGGY